ncbi:MAG TPA: hypothetical protein VEP89_13585 [Draconibacterium sp.]|nr:hypothetical protein [Draconibacterium sp.]
MQDRYDKKDFSDFSEWLKPLGRIFKKSYFGTLHIMNQAKPKYQIVSNLFERPQILMRNESATHLFVTTQGGQFETSSPFVFSINRKKI